MIILTGCRSKESPIDQTLKLREALLSSNEISFHAFINADYGEVLYTFEMDCKEDTDGDLLFTVTYPETISGITGVISQSHSALTFDDKVLAFPPYPDGEISPVLTPYLFLKSLVGGYISGCGEEKDGYCIYIDDSYMGNQIKVQVFTNNQFLPVRADVIYRDQRIFTLDVTEFSVM